MSIKTKVLLILLLILPLYMGASAVLERTVILPAFVSLEQSGARENMERCIRAIRREIHHLDLVCWDWASWDDTAEFVVEGSRDYADANLVVNSFTDNHINLIYLVDSGGRVVWGEIYDLAPLKRIRLKDFPETVFPEGHRLTVPLSDQLPPARRAISGIFPTEQGPMLVAARPILTSENEGPSRGTLIMGRFLDAKLIETLVEQTQVNFEIFPNAGLPGDLAGIPHRLTDQSPYLILPDASGRTLIHGRLQDVQGEPYLLIRAGIPSTITKTGISTLRKQFFFELGLAVVLTVTMMLVMKGIVLNSLSLLTRRVLEVGETGDPSGRMGLEGRDEIGTLAREFDRMLEKLEDRAEELAGANERLREDMDRRIQAEETLRSSERYYRSLLHCMHEEILVVDREFRIADANKPRLELFGRNRHDILGMPCFELFSAQGKDPVHPLDLAGMEEIFQVGGPKSCRFKLVDGSGMVTWMDILLSPLKGVNDETTHVIMALRDVTQEAELEKSLQQSRKLEAIGTLAGGIAHDFNNVLMTVMINTELALRRAPQDPILRESLELSLEASRRARDLVAQILTFSRKSEMETIPLKVTPVIDETLRILRASLPATIHIEKEIEAPTDTVMAAPSHIHQVFINLAANAAHAMKESGGTLSVSLKETPMDSSGASRIAPDLPPGNYLELSVKDTGHGMAPDILDRIFEPFFTTKKPGEGTGMGLSVVHGIVKGMKGAIAVESEPGKGSTFRVFLPAVPMPKGDLPEDSAAPRKGSGRILIVDDNRFVVLSLQIALRQLGYEVTGKTDSTEALALFQRDPEAFDLVITDQVMPGLTGTELAQGVLSVRPDIPVILCSGYSEIVSREHAAALGIREYLMKPVSGPQLARAIDSLL